MGADRQLARQQASNMARLHTALGYEFRDGALLSRALTHRSGGPAHNERLEFLGDAVLGFVVAAELFRRCPNVNESRLTLMRAALVRRDALAVIGRTLALADVLRVGIGERKSGAVQRASVLADTVEALIGAVFVDGGYRAARGLVLRLVKEALEAVIAEGANKDAKTRLQEFLQARALALPVYTTIARDGVDGHSGYQVVCHVPSSSGPTTPPAQSSPCEPQGQRREARAHDGDVRNAEQKAAAALLARLQEEADEH